MENAPTDRAIADRLRAIIGALDQDQLTVSVEAGVVTLAGDVADPVVSKDVAGIAELLEGAGAEFASPCPKKEFRCRNFPDSVLRHFCAATCAWAQDPSTAHRSI
ncbi:BON domain-containing protein [Amaricoccus macauensis]|uniref:BON domain-containing protein n=1 Tax=Amaricoccus macauensis TaxID=57001 RepID=UPI003C7DF9D0